jgi:DeoR/GlpR family transcriptional regulator of sugar metabolism
MQKISNNAFLKQERHDYIIKQLNLHNKVLSTELGQELNVSEDTIRRDLIELAEHKKIIKVHGGALSRSYHESSNHEVYAQEKKIAIAQKAVGLIKDNMLILTSGGTTIRELIKLLPDSLNATFCTNSLSAAEALLKHPKIEVIFIGGKISKDARMCVGGDAILKLSEISFDLCLMGTNGIDAKNGLTDSDLEVVQVKKAMRKASKKMVVLAISEKLNSVSRATICRPKEIDFLITELNPTDTQLADYQHAGMELM